MRALILAPFDRRQVERLGAGIDVTHESWIETGRINDPDKLAERIREEGFTILVIEVDFVFEEMFEQAPGLRFVGICRASTSHVDVDAATENGVIVVNTPGRNARAVAEHALGLILSLARHIPGAHRYVASGAWQHPLGAYVDLRGVEVGGRTLGIVGLGAIGRNLAEMAGALGMRVIAYDPYVQGTVAGVTMAELERVASESDFISVHVPTSAETIGLIDKGFVDLMKSSAHLVNCSDASIIEEAAIVDALRNRRIAGAAFDVFETQPIAPDSPLLTLDNVVLTPHIGGATAETVQRHSEMMTDDIERFVRGVRPVNLVNPRAWCVSG